MLKNCSNCSYLIHNNYEANTCGSPKATLLITPPDEPCYISRLPCKQVYVDYTKDCKYFKMSIGAWIILQCKRVRCAYYKIVYKNNKI